MSARGLIRALAVGLVLALPVPGPALAVQPDEVLDDPVMEARAREISRGLRCLVCRNEAIDESNAELARDMRLLVRERLVEGDTDEEVVAFIVDRYGEYVLLQPTLTGSNLALWLAAPGMLLVGGGIAVVYLRRRKARPEPAATLTPDEQARLKDLLGD
jgi:cytochrome c-type biogenesis protein CcmH